MNAATIPRRTHLGCLLGIVLVASLLPVRSLAQEGMTPVDRAKQAYAEGEYGKVITELEAALVHASVYSTEERASIYLYLGLAYQAFGRAERAHQAFVEAIRLSPDLELEPSVRSPQVEEAFEHARWVVREEVARRSTEESSPVPLGQAIEMPHGPTGKTRWGGLWRSCLFPGWGQLYGERRVRGYAFMAGELISLAAAVYATVERDRAHDDYQSALGGVSQADINAFYDDYDSWRKTRGTFLVVAGGIWALNVLESLLNDPSVPKEQRAMGEWRVGSLRLGPGGWRVGLSKAF